MTPAELPAFYKLFPNREQQQPTTRPAPVAYNGDTTPYAAKALANEIDNVAGAVNGTRNDTLNRAGYSLAQLVAAGHIDEQTVHTALVQAARHVGLPDHEIEATLRSSLGAGKQHPRIVPDLAPAVHEPPSVGVAGAVQAAAPDGDIDPEDIHAIIRERLPVIDWHQLWDSEDDEEWIIEPILPARRLVALFSAPKLGKSLLMLELAVAVSRGTEVLSVKPDRPRRVLYVDFENDPRGDVRTRLDDMHVGPDQLGNLCYMSYPRLAKLDTPTGAQDLMMAVHEYDCEVVIIDTISRAVAGEENENDTWLNFYRNTGMQLKAAGVACIRLDHTGKDHEKGMRGGSAKYGDVDAVWKLTGDPGDPNILRLICTDNRMPVDPKTLTLTRHDTPRLHHRVEGAEGALVIAEMVIDAINRDLDDMKLPNTVSVRDARKRLQEAGKGRKQSLLVAALKLRKQRPDSLKIEVS